MIGPFSYSLNGEDFVGNFDSREAAQSAGAIAARRAEDSPTTFFVARVVKVDSKAAGHARAVLSHMAARAREEAGDAANRYLANLTPAQINDLDTDLEKTITAWLDKYHLTPDFYRVEAISQHPVVRVIENHMFATMDEVHDLGVGDTLAGN